MKTESEKLYEDCVRKSFFRNEDERNLWVRLNAEHIRYCHKVVNNQDIQDLGNIDKPYSHLWVSNNQLTYDEYMRDEPRFSLEELAAMSREDLLELSDIRNRETIKEMFDETSNNDDDEWIVYGEDGKL